MEDHHPSRARSAMSKQPTQSTREEPTWVDLFQSLYKARLFIMIGVMAGVILAGLWAMIATPYYKASLIIAPASPMNGAEVSSLLADDNLFALRYLVQRVGAGQSSDFLRFETIHDGPSVAQILLAQEDVVRGIAQDRRFVFTAPFYEEWMPSLLSEYLHKKLTLEPVHGTSLRRLSYHHPNPEFAKYLLDGVHMVADALIRKNVKEEAGGRIAYLDGQIQNAKNPEHRRALTTLMMEQERLLMLASLDQPYAASIVEPASASPKPVWPNIPLLFSALSFAGAAIGVLVFVMVSGLRGQDEQDEKASGGASQKPRPMRKWFSAESKPAANKQSAQEPRKQPDMDSRPLSGRAAE